MGEAVVSPKRRTRIAIESGTSNRRVAAYKMRRRGMTWIEIGLALGVSRERAGQLGRECWSRLGSPDVPQFRKGFGQHRGDQNHG